MGLTVPCVTGPYTNVAATLTLLGDRARVSSSTDGGYAYTGIDDARFRHHLGGIQSIATSSAQNDRGAFDFAFRDERFLPFEGRGAIGSWQLSLPAGFRSFDYDTISDVVIHLSYKAREGGMPLRTAAEEHVAQSINRWLDELAEDGSGLVRLISLKHEFPNALHQLLFPIEGEPPTTELAVTKRLFPYFLHDRELTASQAELAVTTRGGEALDVGELEVTLNGVAATSATDVGALPAVAFALDRIIESDGAPWPLAFSGGGLDPATLDDLYILVTYTVGP